MYKIERTEYIYNSDDEAEMIKEEWLPVDYKDHEKADSRIKDFAEAWRDDANMVHHHAGQSVVYFKWGYIEFSRSQDIQNIS